MYVLLTVFLAISGIVLLVSWTDPAWEGGREGGSGGREWRGGREEVEGGREWREGGREGGRGKEWREGGRANLKVHNLTTVDADMLTSISRRMYRTFLRLKGLEVLLIHSSTEPAAVI